MVDIGSLCLRRDAAFVFCGTKLEALQVMVFSLQCPGSEQNASMFHAMFHARFLREREEKAAQEVAERVESSFSSLRSLPSAPQSVDELSRRVDAIRAEKDELASELRALQDISQRERDITRDRRDPKSMQCAQETFERRYNDMLYTYIYIDIYVIEYVLM